MDRFGILATGVPSGRTSVFWIQSQRFDFFSPSRSKHGDYGPIARQRFKVHAPCTSWICAQIGAREHYAIPRVLHRAGKLEALYTDYWSAGIWKPLSRLLRAKRLAGRCHDDLTDAEVYSFNAATIGDSLLAKLRHSPGAYAGFLNVGGKFGRRVRSRLARRREQDWNNTIFFGYDTGFLETAAWVRERGAKCVVGQMDPSSVEVEMVRREELKWPGWAKTPLLVPEEYFAWRKTEWALADIVMVNSAWTRSALVTLGVPEEKIAIVPLAYEPENRDLGAPPLRPESAPLRVLFLGQVNLRKGIPYLLEAAALLRRDPVQIDIVGPIAITDRQVVSAPTNVRFHGPAPRSKVREFYEAADVFVLPTVSDGFALTQLEAMSHALPVITTPNCGEVVRDGIDGFVIPAADSMSLANAIRSLLEDPERHQAMREEAARGVARFSLDQLGKNLRDLEARLTGIRPPSGFDVGSI